MSKLLVDKNLIWDSFTISTLYYFFGIHMIINMPCSVIQCLLFELHLQQIVQLEKLQKWELFKGKSWSFNMEMLLNLCSGWCQMTLKWISILKDIWNTGNWHSYSKDKIKAQHSLGNGCCHSKENQRALSALHPLHAAQRGSSLPAGPSWLSTG